MFSLHLHWMIRLILWFSENQFSLIHEWIISGWMNHFNESFTGLWTESVASLKRIKRMIHSQIRLTTVFLSWISSFRFVLQAKLSNDFVRFWHIAYIYTFGHLLKLEKIFVYSTKQKAKQVWSDMRVSKWWSLFHFRLNYSF